MLNNKKEKQRLEEWTKRKEDMGLSRVRIGSIEAWQLEAFEEMILDPKTNQNQLVIVNLSSHKSFKELRASIEQYTFFYMPFTPFGESRETLVFEEIHRELEVKLRWEDKDHSFGPKIAKTRLAKLTKLFQ
jgi:hypothetical protein